MKSEQGKTLAVIFLMGLVTSVQATDATWTAGSGLYSMTSNWDVPIVPCNESGGGPYDVLIPGGGGTVTADVGPCSVISLELGSGRTFVAEQALGFDVLGLADISGVVTADAGSFQAPFATFSGNASKVFAQNGGTVLIGAADYTSTGLISGSVISATGPSSLVDLSSLGTINAAFNDASGSVRAQVITASNGGTIDFSGLTEIVPPARTEDRIDISLPDSTGTILLPGLTNLVGAGQVRFDVDNGGSLSLPAIQVAEEAIFDVTSAGSVTAAASNLTYSSTRLVSGTIFNVSGAGSRLDLTSMSTLNAGFNDASGTVRFQTINTSNGGELNLSGLSEITTPARSEDRLDFVFGDSPSSLLLPALETISGAGRARFDVNAGAMLQLPLLTSAKATFEAEGGSTISLPAILSTQDTIFDVRSSGSIEANTSSLSYSTTGLISGTIMFSTGAGSTLDLASIEDLNAGFNDASGSVRAQTILAADGGLIDLSGLTAIQPPARTEDRLDISLIDGAGSILLPALQTIAGAGQVRFDVDNGAYLSLPSLAVAEEAIFDVNSGGVIESNASSLQYSSTRLVSGTILSANGENTVLDLAAMRNLDAGFNDASGTVRAQSVVIGGGALMDLSGLQTVTTPARGEDRLDVFLSDAASSLLLDDLETIAGAGRARFRVELGASLDFPVLNGAKVTLEAVSGAAISLPAIATITDGIFDVQGGSQIVANVSPWDYQSTGLNSATIMFVADENSLLDLSMMQSLNAGFNDVSGTVRAQTVVATDDATIDLSGLNSITTPARSEDRLDFSVTGGAYVDLGGLQSIGGAGAMRISIGDAIEMSGGVVRYGGAGSANSLDISLNDATSLLDVPDSLIFVGDNSLTAAAGSMVQVGLDVILPAASTVDLGDSATLLVGRDFNFSQTDETRLQAAQATLHFNGAAPQVLEVGGFDIGTVSPADDNFDIGRLIVGDSGAPTQVHLADMINNGNGQDSLCGEALYLLGADADPNALQIRGGSTLFLNGYQLYALQDGILMHINSFLPVGVTMIGYDGGFIERGTVVATDTDGDGVSDLEDNCGLVANPTQQDTDSDGFGNRCDADLDNDGVASFPDLAIMKALFFMSGDLIADLDSDGIVSFPDLGLMKEAFFGQPGPSCVARSITTIASPVNTRRVN